MCKDEDDGDIEKYDGHFENNQKTFICQRCSKAYKYSRSLKKHLKYECGVKPQFQCSYCDYRTKIKSSLKRHIIRKHLPTVI